MNQFTFTSTGKHKGILLSYKQLKQGNFVEATPAEARTLMTSMLTDIPTELWTFCQKLAIDTQRKVIKPNSFTSATLIIEYASNDFSIQIKRKLKSPFIVILFPSHAELPTSYNIAVEVSTSSNEVANKIKAFLQEITQGRRSTLA
ncbi:hypothetical protein BKI52_45220 [marine bacterium AO1-C]|nr:hypothetical protein BKI52_45220 [marine bacterium AO1-C]